MADLCFVKMQRTLGLTAPCPISRAVHSTHCVARRPRGRLAVRSQDKVAADSRAAGDLASDHTKKALEFQLKRSAQIQANRNEDLPVPDPEPNQALQEDLKRRQQEARRWIAPWLDAKARKRSQEANAHVRGRGAAMSSEQESAALERLLQQNGRQAAAGASEAAADPSGFSEADSASSNDSRSRVKPCETYEDGSVLYTAAVLGDVNYEDLLTP
ncbi:hypothetical protein WJX72_002846 [[Myrmecia] bisecta]|uniref:Uncharacterized protein n=1 Tax=[Myrmecia] bisecta TaxID=41462 RepID=A0AAW1QPM6_9CHLO